MCSPANAATTESNPEIHNRFFIFPSSQRAFAVFANPAVSPWRSAIIPGQTQRPGKIFVEPMGPEPVTELLLRWRAGDQECLNRLLPQVEGELRRIAHRYMRMEPAKRDAH
jgi:hypothetical protein